MTDTPMTRFPGVHRRSDSSVWWFGLRAPKALLHRFANTPWAVRCSLGTSDLRTANDKARGLHAEWALRFAAWNREENPQRVTLTPALAAIIAAEVRRWVLEADDNMRGFPEGPRALVAREERRRLIEFAGAASTSTQFDGPSLATLLPLPAGALSGLTIAGVSASSPPKKPEVEFFGGLSDDELQALASFNAQADGAAAVGLAGRRWPSMLPLAQAVTKSIGLSVDWGTPEGRVGLLNVLKAHRQATADLVRRDAGDVIDTPAQAQPQEGPQAAPDAPAVVKQGHTPRDAFDAWEKAKPGRPRKSIETYRTAADKLAALLPGKSLETLTKEDGRDVVAALLRDAQAKGGTAQNTAVNLLGRFSTLLEQAVDLDWVDKNPFEKRTIGRVPSQVSDWKLAELVKLFDHPLFTAYALPSTGMAGMDAAYWLPLLGLFTGARISELAQLGTADVEDTSDAGLVLTIRDDAEQGQRVKNQNSSRRVPVHPELVRLGFRDYWQAIIDHARGPLFPAIARTELNGAGGKVSQWFGSFKTSQGFGAGKVFHGFRHTLQTRLLAAGAPEPHVDAITGHAGQSVGRRTYTHLTPADVRPSLERLQFPGVTLPRVFEAPAWRPSN